MSHSPLIRTLYLYLFSLVGLILLTIGGIGFINMGLRAFVFTYADEEQWMYRERPPVPVDLRTLERMETASNLTEDEKSRLKKALKEHEDWEEKRKKVDPVKARRHRDAAHNLAFVLIGIPLYLYHWRQIRSDVKHAKTTDF